MSRYHLQAMFLTRPGFRGVLLAALALLHTTVNPAIAQPRIPGAPLPFDPTVRHGSLENGLRYYIRRNTEPAAQANLWLAVRAGSSLEEDDQRGLARFVARMAPRGTEQRSAREIADHLASIGASAVPAENVQTGFDVSLFHLDLPSGSPEAVQGGIEILAEWAFAAAFSPDEIERERASILAEQDAAPGIDDDQLAALFGESRYANRQPAGLREVVETATPQQLAALYRRWYRPQSMALIAVGDFDPEIVESAVRRHFETPAQDAGERGSVRGVPETFAIPDHTEPRVSVVAGPGVEAAHLTLYRKLPADTGADLAAYRDRLLQWLVETVVNARLAGRQQADQSFLSAAVGRNRLTGDVDVSIATARTAGGGVERGLQALLEELRRVEVHGFTDAEVEHAKAALTHSVQDAYEARDRRPSHLLAEEYLRHFLEGGLYPGVERERELHRLQLPEITAADLHRWAVRTLPSSSTANTVLLVTEPVDGEQAAAAARETRLRDLLAAATALEVEPYGGIQKDANPAVLLATQPPRGSIEQERHVLEVGARRWTLSNGIVVIAKQTDFADDEVLFQASSPGGTSLVADADFVPALTAATVIAGSGVGPHDRAALEELLAGKQVSVAPYIAELFEGFSGGAAAHDLETLFQLIYLYATRPRVDGRFYAQYESQLRAQAERRAARPEVAFADTLRITLSQGHLRARPVTTQLLEELDLERAVQVYADRFADFSDFTFLFVGAFDWHVLRDLAEAYLAALPAGTRREHWRDVGIDPPPGIEDRTVRGGAAGRSTTRLVFAGDMRRTRREAVTIAALGEVLQERLRERLPGPQESVTAIGVSSDSQLIPDPEYRVIVGFDCDPSRADEVRDAVLAEIAWLQRGGEQGSLEAALADAKDTLHAAWEERLAGNRFWLDRLLSAVRNDEPLSEVVRYAERLQALRANQLAAAARRYLTPDRYVRVVLLPE